jgi:putative ABC transport system permease protein
MTLFHDLTGVIAMVAVGVTSVFLVVGGIVIMNIMLAAVSERTHEIGIRKSLGARRRDILLQFLVEAALLSTAGGLLGVFVAWVGTRIMTATTPIPSSLPMSAVFTAVLVSAAVGLFFGIYPANKAAQLDPIAALRAD